MAKIRSTTELIYDSRSGIAGIVQLEITSWNFNPINSSYVATVVDYVITTEDNQEVKRVINQKRVNYSKDEIDALFGQLQNSIELNESFTNEMYNLIGAALLYSTQQDPIYLSQAQDWELVP